VDGFEDNSWFCVNFEDHFDDNLGFVRFRDYGGKLLKGIQSQKMFNAALFEKDVTVHQKEALLKELLSIGVQSTKSNGKASIEVVDVDVSGL